MTQKNNGVAANTREQEIYNAFVNTISEMGIDALKMTSMFGSNELRDKAKRDDMLAAMGDA